MKGFIPKLKDHLITRLHGADYNGDEVQYSDVERQQIRILNHNIYCHKVLRVQYTTYDVQRGQDSINARTNHRYIMVNSRETGAGSHPYWYTQVLGAFHTRALHVGTHVTNRSPQNMPFLWVRWLGMESGYQYGHEKARLSKIGFLPDSDPSAFGFLDPSLVIRSCHLIPAFVDGRTDELLPFPSVARDLGEVDDWAAFYVNM